MSSSVIQDGLGLESLLLYAESSEVVPAPGQDAFWTAPSGGVSGIDRGSGADLKHAVEKLSLDDLGKTECSPGGATGGGQTRTPTQISRR